MKKKVLILSAVCILASNYAVGYGVSVEQESSIGKADSVLSKLSAKDREAILEGVDALVEINKRYAAAVIGQSCVDASQLERTPPIYDNPF